MTPEQTKGQGGAFAKVARGVGLTWLALVCVGLGCSQGEGPQADPVDEDTTMVFLSMGGNDARFSHFLTECLAASFANGSASSEPSLFR